MVDQTNNKAMNVTLWIAQALLGIMFLMAGLTKVLQPIETLAETLTWAPSLPVGLVRFIGISEFLGGLGLLVPSLFRFKPVLSVWAALGIATVMLFAAIFHAARAEYSAIGMNVIFMVIAVFISWGRSKKAPILSKA